MLRTRNAALRGSNVGIVPSAMGTSRSAIACASVLPGRTDFNIWKAHTGRKQPKICLICFLACSFVFYDDFNLVGASTVLRCVATKTVQRDIEDLEASQKVASIVSE